MPEPATMRYSEDELGGWILHGITNSPLVERGDPGTQPEWLKSILSVGRVAGYVVDVPRPPPAIILWFRITKNYELVEFVEV